MEGSITWQELVSQPSRWRDLARHPPQAAEAWARVRSAGRVVVFGSGSSYYLAALVGDAIRAATGRPVVVRPSCEIMLDPEASLASPGGECVAVGFSRSGESSEVVAATVIAQQRGIHVLGVTCTAGSTLAREADEAVVVPQGLEDGMVMLRSFTCMLLACHMAIGAADPDAVSALADHGEALLTATAPGMRALANSRPFDRFVLLGSGADHALAQEAALKLQEMAIATTEAYYTLEYRHGPRSTGGATTLAVLFAPKRDDLGVELVKDLMAQGLAVMVVGGDIAAYQGVATQTVPVGTWPEPLRQPLMLLPVQMLAFATARRTGQDPDSPRNLAKVVLL